MCDNYVSIEFLSKSENEGFARVAIASFASSLDPTLEEIEDIKTAVSEAVTNSIIHGYENSTDKLIKVNAFLDGNKITIEIIDNGVGIKDISEARTPLFTSRPDLERSGMGFTLMESFMDDVEVKSSQNQGTKVIMKKTFGSLGPV